MAKVTPKENFLKLSGGGYPYYVPFYSIMGDPYMGECAVRDARVAFFEDTGFQGGVDMWGVPYARPSSGIEAPMPDTRITVLEEITDWADIVKFPDPLSVDLEKAYAENLKRIDRSQTCLALGPGLNPFQELVALMGFEGGLIALAEDPEEVSALLNAMVDHIMPHFKKAFEVFKPDFWHIVDDTCSRDAPFFSPAIYEEVFLPIYTRLCEPAIENGVPVLFHNCGNLTPFLEFMYKFGVRVTEPFQEMNDIVKCKEQFKGRMSFIGHWGWGSHIPKNYPDFDEEEFRQDIRNTIDECAVGGEYGFSGFPIGIPGDPGVKRATQIMRDEVHWYGRKVYGYTGE
ncbi:MAG: hypothetical protein IKE62_01650 [Oscillospiraceae bacterium]|nr:hypothetical protein [Oscillospiraceae bacterium]